jgi:hypothetical protein
MMVRMSTHNHYCKGCDQLWPCPYPSCQAPETLECPDCTAEEFPDFNDDGGVWDD